ncbi:eps i polysaccharide export outer membrane transmembrane protein [Oceanicola granulosus HTCC2516]|uniref:Eps i polysaccharide export outer membrane transmembrane protein n=1 Tax=Oceanicola granulosus (strain ATCC BAA-861 / DSM 15982 / KCTC 12143 / HTCC2516) TaxID=314256 RepID=Q2CAF0_OCEGH|nr:eps i polysaccharide export outer membrane transmembrane protein [Oceanicola granulosus HTCC2516]
MLGTALTLGGCGVSYNSPSVQEQVEGLPVTVVPLDSQALAFANSAPYTPRSLPAIFHQVAGSSGSVRGLGALPNAPAVPTLAPQPLELRVPPAVEPQPYEIGVGDVVLLATKSASGSTVEQLSGLLAAQSQRQGYTVRDDGAIAIPGIGQIQLAGLTLEEAEAAVFDAIVRQGVDPAFSLEVAEFNSKRVAVGGAVAAARLVPITLNTLDLGEALTAAGGVTLRDQEYASIRIYRDGTLYQIPVETFFARPELQNTVLQAGDSVYVDTNYDLDRALQFYEQQLDVTQLRSSARLQALNELQAEIALRRAALAEARANFTARADLGAEERDYVYLAGEVAEQSRFPLPYDRQASLADVLFDRGGLATATGDPTQIYVLRPSRTATGEDAVTAWHLDAGNAAALVLATKFEMRPNDILFVEAQPITKWSRALQQALPTLITTAAASVTN